MNVKVYSTNCPMCKVLIRKLESKHIPFELIEDIEIMKSKGFLSAPQLEVNEQVFDFNSARKLVDAFDDEVGTFVSFVTSRKAE